LDAGLLTLGVLAWGACTGDAPAPQPELDLTVRAVAGEVRAGKIRRPEELIGGPTARGRVGDFKLYNSRVAFIVSAAGAPRGYSPYHGKVVDADLVRAPGEPGQSRFGEWVLGFDQRVSDAQKATLVSTGGARQSAIVRVEGPDVSIPILDVILSGIVTSRPRNAWISTDFILEPDADTLRVETSIENRKDAAETYQMRQIGLLMGDGAQPWIPTHGFDVTGGDTPYFAAIAEEVSYGIFEEAPIGLLLDYQSLQVGSLGTFTLAPREKRTFKAWLAVGPGDTASLLRAHAAATKRTLSLTRVDGKVQDAAGLGVANARVHALRKVNDAFEALGVARTSADGTYALEIPSGDYELQATSSALPASVRAPITVPATPTAAIAGPMLRVPDDGTLAVKVTDERGERLPAKITVAAGSGPRVSLPKMLGAQRYAGGAARIAFARTGEERMRLEAGRYKVTVSRGFEYSLAQTEVDVPAGREATVALQLARVVDTRGWLSGDFHVHSQASPDSDDLDETKVSAFVAEGLEVPVSTDHEFVADYAPTIARLGVGGWVRSIVGEEVTTFSLGHFNAFPLAIDSNKWNNGAIAWHFKAGPEIFAAIRANPATPIIQVNHPRSTGAGGYFSAVGYDAATRTVEKPEDWSLDFDAIELINGKGAPAPTTGIFLDWYSLLNSGKRVTANGNSDSHNALPGSEVGFPRNYVKVPSDDVAAFDERAFIDSVRRGRVVVSGGPFIDASIGGKGPGDDVSASNGRVTLDVVVQAAPWIAVNQLVVVANGEAVHTRDLGPGDADPSNPVVRFRGAIEIPAGADAWFVVHVRGPGTLDPVVTGGRPFAFTNPIYVDVDGDGRFTAPDSAL
jgi:hypothetical protein